MSSKNKFNPHKLKAAIKKEPLGPLETVSIDEIIKELKIDNNQWDAIIIGDGSGHDWKRATGWSSILIDHYSNYRMIFYGGWSTGTSYIAEIMPYIEALTWYVSGPGKICKEDMKKDGDPKGYIRIHIITDNIAVANQGNRLSERSTYPWLWDSINGIEREGVVLTWHWLGRNTLGLNRLADDLSRRCRIQMEELIKKASSDIGVTEELLAYEFNPDIKVKEDDV